MQVAQKVTCLLRTSWSLILKIPIAFCSWTAQQEWGHWGPWIDTRPTKGHKDCVRDELGLALKMGSLWAEGQCGAQSQSWGCPE